MVELKREFRKMLREVKADCEADKLKTYSLSLLSLFTSLCLLPVRSLMASWLVVASICLGGCVHVNVNNDMIPLTCIHVASSDHFTWAPIARRRDPKPPLPPLSPGLGRRSRGSGARGESRGRNLGEEVDHNYLYNINLSNTGFYNQSPAILLSPPRYLVRQAQ